MNQNAQPRKNSSVVQAVFDLAKASLNTLKTLFIPTESVEKKKNIIQDNKLSQYSKYSYDDAEQIIKSAFENKQIRKSDHQIEKNKKASFNMKQSLNLFPQEIIEEIEEENLFQVCRLSQNELKQKKDKIEGLKANGKDQIVKNIYSERDVVPTRISKQNSEYQNKLAELELQERDKKQNIRKSNKFKFESSYQKILLNTHQQNEIKLVQNLDPPAERIIPKIENNQVQQQSKMRISLISGQPIKIKPKTSVSPINIFKELDIADQENKNIFGESKNKINNTNKDTNQESNNFQKNQEQNQMNQYNIQVIQLINDQLSPIKKNNDEDDVQNCESPNVSFGVDGEKNFETKSQNNQIESQQNINSLVSIYPQQQEKQEQIQLPEQIQPVQEPQQVQTAQNTQPFNPFNQNSSQNIFNQIPSIQSQINPFTLQKNPFSQVEIPINQNNNQLNVFGQLINANNNLFANNNNNIFEQSESQFKPKKGKKNIYEE